MSLPIVQFNGPEGMLLQEETLYVADTGNHFIRKIDLPGENHVSTLKIRGPKPP